MSLHLHWISQRLSSLSSLPAAPRDDTPAEEGRKAEEEAEEEGGSEKLPRTDGERRGGGEGGEIVLRGGEQCHWNGNVDDDGSRQRLRASGAKLPCSGRALPVVVGSRGLRLLVCAVIFEKTLLYDVVISGCHT